MVIAFPLKKVDQLRASENEEPKYKRDTRRVCMYVWTAKKVNNPQSYDFIGVDERFVSVSLIKFKRKTVVRRRERVEGPFFFSQINN